MVLEVMKIENVTIKKPEMMSVRDAWCGTKDGEGGTCALPDMGA